MKELARIVLPLPKRILSPNHPPISKRGRIAKAVTAKKYRSQAKDATLALDIESGPWKKASVSVVFYHKVKRYRDDVNALAMLKPAYDGVVDAGLIVDDNRDCLETKGASFAIDKDWPRVELIFARED